MPDEELIPNTIKIQAEVPAQKRHNQKEIVKYEQLLILQPDNIDLFYKLAMAFMNDHSNYVKVEELLQ